MIFEVYTDDGHKAGEKKRYRHLLAFNSYDSWRDYKDHFDPNDFPDRRNPRLAATFHQEQVSVFNDPKDLPEGVCF